MKDQITGAGWSLVGIKDLEDQNVVQLGRGKVISKKDLAATPGSYPVYSSAKEKDGKFGEYGRYMFDEELITWSVDGGGRLFHRPKHRFSITNVGGFIRVLKPEIINCRFLYLALSFLHGQEVFDWVRKAHPSVIRNVYTEIPLPPLEEQKRIVAVLDQAFAALDRARAHTEANLAAAGALFSQARAAALSPESAPATWTSEKLGDCLDVQSGFAFRSADYVDHGHFLVRIANVQDGELSLHRPRYVALDDRTRRFELHAGDVLTSLTGNIGRVAEVDTEHLPAALNQRVARLLIKDRHDLSHDFLLHFLRSELFGDILRDKSHGAAQQNVSPKEIAQVPILFPPLSEQMEISRKLDTMWGQVQALRRCYEVALDDIGALRQSLLQKAFSGRLTA